MFKRESQLRLYLGGFTAGYSHDWVPGIDNELCHIAIFLEDLLLAYYEKMMKILEDSKGVFDNTVEGVKREQDRICFMTYFSNSEEQTWISYSSFLMLMKAWKEVILYEPQEMVLHKIREEVWLTFERPALEKALIKHSLEGYSFFVGTPGEATLLAQSFLQVDYTLVQHIIFQDRWDQLLNEFIEFTKKNYFRITVQKKDDQWALNHSETTINRYGEECFFSDLEYDMNGAKIIDNKTM